MLSLARRCYPTVWSTWRCWTRCCWRHCRELPGRRWQTLVTRSHVIDLFYQCVQALGLYISATTKSDSCFLALARHLSSHLVVRGRGFVIAARLPSEDLVKLHKELVTYTIKKYKTLANQEKHASKNKALVMFKGLVHCLIGMTGKEAAIM